MTTPAQRPAPWSASDRKSFAFESTAKRWPTILTQAIDALYQAASAIHSASHAEDAEARTQESKQLIEKLAKLKHDIARDHTLEPLPQDQGPDVALYNSILQKDKPTWFTAAWLFAECYLYRSVRILFAQSKHWTYYDPFANQKLSAFRSSGAAIEQLAKTVEDLIEKADSGDAAAGSPEGQKLAFTLLAQTSLWGNATDLSLLTSLTHADIQTLQAGGIGADAQKGREKFILSGLGALDSAWNLLAPLRSSGGGRVDIVLDNSGFELVTDLMLGQWLVATGHATEVVFHAKALPWFVSDVTPPDFVFTLEALQETRFFAADNEPKKRSVSGNRNTQADMSHFSGETRPHPAGSKSLQMQAPEGESAAAPPPAGSHSLQAKADDSEERGRGKTPAGSLQLTMDPAYFQNARSRTVSPSRSFLIDSTTVSFSSLGVVDEDSARVSRPSAVRSSSRGFRSTSSDRRTATQRLAATWTSYLSSGKFKLSVPPSTKLGASTSLAQGDFWTEGVSYDQLGSVAPELLKDLQTSTLVIFKGDLNYRKLTGDLTWDPTTAFETSLGDLAGQIDLLALRTCKADVVVGLDEDTVKRAQAEDSAWRTNGKYAVVQFSGKKR